MAFTDAGENLPALRNLGDRVLLNEDVADRFFPEEVVSREVDDKVIVSEEDLHDAGEEMVKAYDLWLDKGMWNGVVQIWRPGSGDIATFGSEQLDRAITLLSVLGLKPANQNITRQEITAAVIKYIDWLETHADLMTAAREGVKRVVDYARENSLKADLPFDQFQKIFFVKSQRLSELNPGFGEEIGGMHTGDILLITQDQPYPIQTKSFAAHESLHEVRVSNDLLDKENVDEIEEGIVQLKTEALLPKGDPALRYILGPIYVPHKWVAQSLEGVMQRDIFTLSRMELIHRFKEIFPKANAFYLFMHDVRWLCDLHNQYVNSKIEHVPDENRDRLHKQVTKNLYNWTKLMTERWKFSWPKNPEYFKYDLFLSEELDMQDDEV